MPDNHPADPVPDQSGRLPDGPTAEPIRIDYVPRAGLGRITLSNGVLWILTLGLYRFWAKTRVRRHIWGCVHVNGEPFEYTGTGMELFKGAIVVFLVLVLPAGLLVSGVSLAFGPEHPAVAGVQILIFLAVSVLWGAAIYRARRYQLSRTLWRGIRGDLEGSALVYSLLWFGALLARAMTLGWSTPVMNFNLQQQIVGDMRVGDMKFRFKGRAGPLYPAYAASWFIALFGFLLVGLTAATAVALASGLNLDALLARILLEDATGLTAAVTVLTALIIGYIFYTLIYPIVWSIYIAREMSVFAGATQVDKASFEMRPTVMSLIGLGFGNALIAILSLGFAMPFVHQRTIRYVCDRLRVNGTVDIDRIRQSQAARSRTGEGLADAFDMGGI